MQYIRISPGKEVVNRCAKGGAIIVCVLMFATGAFSAVSTGPFFDQMTRCTIIGGIGGAIGAGLETIVGMIINAMNPSRPCAATQCDSFGEVLLRLFAFLGMILIFPVCAAFCSARWMALHIPKDMTTVDQIKQFKLASANQFTAAYLPIILACSIFISALLAFGRKSRTIVIAGVISILFYFSGKYAVKYSPNGMTPQQRAVQLFPDLGIANSPLNQEFLRRFKQYKVQNPAYFNNPQWPTQLARESAGAAGTQTYGSVLGPQLALPKNGEKQGFPSWQWNPGWETPFDINSSPGTNYLVKLVDSSNSGVTMTVFVWGGTAVRVYVPLGTYHVKYAAGNKWYGYRYLFGPETSYTKADTTLFFHKEGRQLFGNSITLSRVPNGNVPIKPINASEF